MSSTITPNPKVVALSPLVKAMCQYRNFPLPHQLILAQIDQESAGVETIETAGTKPCAQDNGTGYMQIEGYYNYQSLGFSNCMDCHNTLLDGPYNLDKGICMMRDLYAKTGNYPEALAIYNGGPENPNYNYAATVMEKYNEIYWNLP